ncbi:MAG: magnesium-translocating P-type ATPase [Deltaproteobacteria bacterium]|nr:magnesium-translocating P-type ATPase [Desulfitobacteriaceae bacterium]MDI6854838.1 magnesium-translocating P-type ATPase [Deltaproteobacteria bacterium]
MAFTPPDAFWSLTASDLLERLRTSREGLNEEEARQRLARFGPNAFKAKRRAGVLSLLLSQYKSPIILLLLFACLLSFALRDHVDALIILVILLVSGLLSFWQEYGANQAAAKLLALVQVKATVCRRGPPQEIPVEEIVPGDVVLLRAGDVIPADSLLLESKDLFVDEAALTGETFPVEKAVGTLSPEVPLSRRTNALFMGTHVVSGTAVAAVVFTGAATEFGKVAQRLKLKAPETEFERGVRRFGYFLMEVTLLLVIAIFAINVYLARPVLESFLFSLALAVGLTPQLLPAVISVNLATGAKRMAREKVIVKRLAAIENFGSMNVLCADKTGTITTGVAQVQGALGLDGQPSDKVMLYAYLNSVYESGFANPIDEAIRRHCCLDTSGWRKVDEVPYDFIRKRLSVMMTKDDGIHLMITKGALKNVLEACSTAEQASGEVVPLDAIQEEIQRYFSQFSEQGLRTLGIAYRALGPAATIDKDSERDMTFLGFLLILDPPKNGVIETIKRLKELGVSLKIITGDNRLVAAGVGAKVGLKSRALLTGADLRQLSDEALRQRVRDTQIFAEVEPNQKERIILALRKAGNVVGFMGDGINDSPALHAADVSLSVDSAVDVAKEAADIVLLEKDLGVLVRGVQEGRTTFANTLKYVFMATSANFGNMFSMAGASLFLSFLPLLPKQILLTNLLTDFPEMTIATDSVDPEMVERPRRWDLRFIRRFMLIFGLISSIFDYLTFGVLLWLLNATPDQFRTGWFQESVISAAVIVLVIRSRRPFFKSRPGLCLLAATLLVVAATVLFPYTPLGAFFNFQPLALEFLLMIGLVLLLYIFSAELAKHRFYRQARHY